MLVISVQGWLGKFIGASPKKTISSLDIRVAINSRKFTPIITHMEFSLKPWELLYLDIYYLPYHHSS